MSEFDADVAGEIEALGEQILSHSSTGADLWTALEQADLAWIAAPESIGGAGLGWQTASGLSRLTGYFAAPIGLSEHLIASSYAGPLHLAPSGRPLTAVAADGAVNVTRIADETFHVRAELRAVPWARDCSHVVTSAADQDGVEVLVAIPLSDAQILSAHNLAGEPRDHVVVATDHAVGVPMAAVSLDADSWRTRFALGRSLLIAGAIERITEMTIEHAAMRTQFGRPLAKFQAVSQLIARLGECSSQSRVAAETAVRTLAPVDAASAKIICSSSAAEAAAIAHQIHGAIGTTAEHPLHRFTQRLWAWQDEDGPAGYWAGELGQSILDELPSRTAWDWLTSATDLKAQSTTR